MDYKPGICTFCGTGCGHFLKVSQSGVDGVFPSRNHPVSRGRLCVRGWNIHELLSTTDRNTTPMVKKSGTFQPVTYEEAITEAVNNLKKFAPGETAFLASPRSSNEENYLFMKMARSVFGTNNISTDTESGHRNSLDVLNEGTGFPGMTGSIEDIQKAEVLLVAGMDITRQNPIIGSELHMASMNGATLVTLDSRTTQIARLSDSFYRINPGSMKVLFNALASAMVANNLYDKSFVEKNTENYNEFIKSIQAVDIESGAKKSGLTVEELTRLAELLAKSKSAMSFFTSGISGLDRDTIGSIYNVFLLAGKIGKEGCGVNPIAGINNLQGSFDTGCAPDLLTGFQSLADQKVRSRFETAWQQALPAEGGFDFDTMMKNGSVKALVVTDHDDGIIKYRDSLDSVEYIVYIGAFRNDFQEFADVVLPITSYIETDGTYTNTERRVQLSSKKMEGDASVMPGWKLLQTMANKAGANWNYASPSDVMNEISQLTPTYSGITYDRLSTSFGLQWPCNTSNPDGTIRYSLESAPRRPQFIKISMDADVPSATDTFPYLLMMGKAQHYWHQNNLMHKTHIPLREYNATLLLYPDGYVEIHPDDAKNLGVRDRWSVRVVSAGGDMEIMAKVSDEVAPGRAYIPYFIRDMITAFLSKHIDAVQKGEDATIPVRIEKV